MKLIQLIHTSGVVQYPDDQALFVNTIFLNDQNIVVGEYIGTMNLTPYTGPWPIVANRIEVTANEMTALLGSTPDSGKQGYRKIYTGAYPNGSNPNADDDALLFMQMLNNLGDELIDLISGPIDTWLAGFVSQGYITAIDKDYVQAGIPT